MKRPEDNAEASLQHGWVQFPARRYHSLHRVSLAAAKCQQSLEEGRGKREGSWLRPSVSTSAVLGGAGPAGVVPAAGGGRRRPDVARLKTDERSSRERLRAAALRRREYSCQPAGRDECQVLSLSLGEDRAP